MNKKEFSESMINKKQKRKRRKEKRMVEERKMEWLKKGRERKKE